MGVRTRIADSLTRIAKVFGPGVPPQFEAGETASHMTPASPFSPGQPIGPYDGYDRTPRSRDFVTGYNIAARPRSHERVSFPTLQGLVSAYDVAQICIWHRIDSIRSLDWKLIADENYTGDVSGAITEGMTVLKKPDRNSAFDGWLAKWLWDVLAYDAGTLYRLRNRGGRTIGLSVIDGTLIAPLLDYWGNPPEEPAEAYVQYVQGLPWNWLTRGDLIYEPFRPRANTACTAPHRSSRSSSTPTRTFVSRRIFCSGSRKGTSRRHLPAPRKRGAPTRSRHGKNCGTRSCTGTRAGKARSDGCPAGPRSHGRTRKTSPTSSPCS